MILALRNARIEIVRWTSESDARAHLAHEVPGLAPHHVGEWHREDRVSSIVATDLAGAPRWSALMAEGLRDPWIAPAFGGLLLVSRENLLLVDDHARVRRTDGPFSDLGDVLVGPRTVWVLGSFDAVRIDEERVDHFAPSYGSWDGWRLVGDRLTAWNEGWPLETFG